MISARARTPALVALVSALGFAVRVALAWRGGGGLHASYGYDTSVYYAAADGLLHGLVPYRDFVLLHPPFVMLVLTPAAALGHVTSDHVGFAAANLAFTGLGALNAGLVLVAARRWGMTRGAALLGALFYATWLGSVEAEFACRLEPLGNTCLLAGLALVAPRDEDGPSSRRRHLVAGVALGLAASTKIWFIVPALAIGLWLIVRRRRVEAARYAAGLVAAFVVVDLPFLILSRGTMFARVVLDQLGRRTLGTPALRWSSIATIGRLPAVAHSTALLVLATAVLGGGIVLALFNRSVTFLAQLALLHLVVLLAAPSWFGFYADYAAAPLALALAAGAGSGGAVWRRVPAGRAVTTTAVIGAVAGLAAVLLAGTARVGTPWRGLPRLAAAVRHDRCVVSDSPAGLIELDRLDRDFTRRCPDWVDVTGKTYFGRDHTSGRRGADVAWQRDLVRYLRSGGAAFVVRSGGDGLTRWARHRLARGRLVLKEPGVTLYQRRPTAADPSS